MALKSEHQQSDRARGITIPFKLLKIAAVVVIVAAAGVAVWYFAIRSSTSTPKKSAHVLEVIHVTYPSDWKSVPAKGVTGVPSDAVIVLEHTGKMGLFVVLPAGKAPTLDAATVRTMNVELAKQYADYKFISAHINKLKPGKALILTYVRTKQGVLHSVTILPAGKASFLIETASPPSNRKVGTEIGQILGSATVSTKS